MLVIHIWLATVWASDIQNRTARNGAIRGAGLKGRKMPDDIDKAAEEESERFFGGLKRHEFDVVVEATRDIGAAVSRSLRNAAARGCADPIELTRKVMAFCIVAVAHGEKAGIEKMGRRAS